MSFWSDLQGILSAKRTSYALVWREQSSQGTVMKGEPISGKSDTDALSLDRARFMHIDPIWTFWILFRPNDSIVTAERGPQIENWPGDFMHVGADSHVLSTLQALRRRHGPVARPLHKVKLKGRG